MSDRAGISVFKIVKNDGISFVAAVLLPIGVFIEIALLMTRIDEEPHLLTYRIVGLILFICLPFLVIVSRIRLTRRILTQGEAVNALVVEIQMVNVPSLHYVAYTVAYDMGGTMHKTIIRDGLPFSMPPLKVGDEIQLRVDPNKTRRILVPSRFISKS